MNISHTIPVTTKHMIAIGAVLVLSTFFASFFHTPTQALSLDPGSTVASVTEPLTNVADSPPVITTLSPLLMNTNMPAPVTTSITIIPTTPVAPPVAVPTTPTPIPTPTPTTSPDITTPAPTSTDTTSTSASVDNAPASYSIVTIRQPSTPTSTSNGLSAIMKQGELLEAPAHIPGGALMYSTHQISAKTANILFLLGATGVVVGGCVIFATRPRTGIIL